jgi:hypothetical protein
MDQLLESDGLFINMTEDTVNDDQVASVQEHQDDTVSTLMNLAGPRATVPGDIEYRVHDHVRKHWQSTVKTRNVARWAIPASLAAALLIAFALNIGTPDVTPKTIGVVAHINNNPGSAGPEFVIGDPVFAGDNIHTGANGGVSIVLKDDISLRIAANSSLRLDQADDIMLLQGQVYVDSGDRVYRSRHLTVNTATGSATDVGTQFAIAFEGSSMSVAVREGIVDIAHEQSVFTAEAGDKLLFQTGSEVVADRIEPFDPSWNWATSLAPDFDITDRSLLDFLKWAARETGKSLTFSSDQIRMAAMSTKVVGSIKNFTPEEALDAVLATTQFDYEISAQSITIK